jgi:hypothetical protein
LAQAEQEVVAVPQLEQLVKIPFFHLLPQLAVVVVVHEIRQKLAAQVVQAVAVVVTVERLARQAQAVKVRLVEQEMFLIALPQVAVVLVPLEQIQSPNKLAAQVEQEHLILILARQLLTQAAAVVVEQALRAAQVVQAVVELVEKIVRLPLLVLPT